MPRKKCPKNIHVTYTEKSALLSLTWQVLKSLRFYEKQQGYFIDDDKRETFQLYLDPDQAPALEEFAEKLHGLSLEV